MTTKISDWIHISEMGGDPWILPIWNAINDKVRLNKILKLPQAIIEIGIHISIRLNMLPRVFQRINLNCSKLYKNLRNAGQKYVSSITKEGYTYEIDDDLKYGILIDIDALLFELNSCCELMCKLVSELHNHAGKPINTKPGIFVKEILSNSACELDWFVSLDTHRNFFIHDGAPYIAVRIFNSTNFELIIMKENLKTFDDPNKFLLVSQINNIIEGFEKAKPIIQKNLVELFKN